MQFIGWSALCATALFLGVAAASAQLYGAFDGGLSPIQVLEAAPLLVYPHGH